jgi:hypothetical protein
MIIRSILLALPSFTEDPAYVSLTLLEFGNIFLYPEVIYKMAVNSSSPKIPHFSLNPLAVL